MHSFPKICISSEIISGSQMEVVSPGANFISAQFTALRSPLPPRVISISGLSVVTRGNWATAQLRWFRHGGDEIYLCSQRIARNRKHRHSTQHSAQQRPIFLNKSAAPKRTRIEYPWISALDTQRCARALCWAAGGFLNPKVLNRNLALLKLISFISISGNLLKMPT